MVSGPEGSITEIVEAWMEAEQKPWRRECCMDDSMRVALPPRAVPAGWLVW
jgi:hypothetical protein